MLTKYYKTTQSVVYMTDMARWVCTLQIWWAMRTSTLTSYSLVDGVR